MKRPLLYFIALCVTGILTASAFYGGYKYGWGKGFRIGVDRFAAYAEINHCGHLTQLSIVRAAGDYEAARQIRCQALFGSAIRLEELLRLGKVQPREVDQAKAVIREAVAHYWKNPEEGRYVMSSDDAQWRDKFEALIVKYKPVE